MLIHWLIVVLTITTYVTADNNDNNTIVIEEDVTNSQPKNSYLLPENLKPELYFLEIKTYLDEFRFEGRVKIRIQCFSNTSEVVLHSKGLNITENEVILTENGTNKAIGILQHSYQTEHDFYILKLASSLQAGHSYALYIPYNAPLLSNLAGYYRSSYKDKKTGETRWLAVTQFEATNARRAFPCFDEPSMKARFHVSLVHHSNYTSISNMPQVSSEQLNDGWVKDVYQESVPMSTYLVAFVVSDFASLESNSGRTKFRVWARPDAVAQASYSLDVGPKILAFFEKYFDVEYPLPKMDMIAIPDFSAAAMENWGLVTYREREMLYEEGATAANAKENLANTISHELAHQWFGNLVTMRWWDDLWLNEGFATYVAAVGLDHVAPQWQSLDNEALTQMLQVFSLDSLQSSHPVSTTIKDPSEIFQIFDAISYSKGSFLLRMMSHFLGDETFRLGVTRYLQKYKFGNAEQDSLWACLEEQAQMEKVDNSVSSSLGRGTVKQIMDSWTLQTGYPVVQVTRNYQNQTAIVSQKRFLIDSNGLSNESLNALWWIPLSFTDSSTVDSSHTRPRSWLHEESSVLNDMPARENWLLLNVNSTALYRINYDPENWRLLSAALRDSAVTRAKIPPLNRAQLIVDSLDLARAGQLDYTSALDMLHYLRHERAYLPWNAAFSNLGYFVQMTRKNAGYGVFRSFMKSLLTPVYSELGEDKFRAPDSAETVPNRKQRTQILGWACSMGVGDCEKQAVEIFDTWKNQVEDPDTYNPVPVDVRSVVYCSAVRLGGQEVWDFLWKRYLAANVATEKSVIRATLGCTKETWLLHKYLDLSLDEKSGIRKQDSYAVFSSVARSSSGFYVAREFLFTRIKEIHAFLGTDSPSHLQRYTEAISKSMNTDDDLTQMQKFVEDNAPLLKDAKLSIKQSLENIQLNVQWRSKYLNIVTDWLSQHANAA